MDQEGNYSLNFLVVDDSPESLEELCQILHDLGHRSQPVESGHQALAKLEAEEFDVILCDLVMPKMDGIDFLREVKARGYAQPVMLITAHGTTSSAVAALRLGADEYLLKPINEELLKHRIQAVMDRRHLADEQADKKRLEGALAMAGAAAHELNQPLTAIMGSIELLSLTSDPERIRTLTERLMTEAERMSQITQKLAKVVRYQTRSYLDQDQIVDLEASETDED
ncbi:MAG: response regulator [Deltaproteobacteria bacterium]|nr:response regulator [Deltaproteobacteria bacterium]